MEEKKYLIRVKGELVEVSKEVYLIYHKMKRRALYLIEREKVHQVCLFSNLDSDEITGEEMIPDMDSDSVEYIATKTLMADRLHECLKILNQRDRVLIPILFFDGKTEREAAEIYGVSHVAIHKKRVRILERLRKII